VVLVATLLAAGCQEPAGTGLGGDAPQATQTVSLGADSRGPAPAVPGAKAGGTITVLLADDLEHLDPARAYVSSAQLTNLMLQRTLTAFRTAAPGRLELVGDLATDTGRASEGGKVWTFTLRDGLRFDDGTPITSTDVAYGIARSFSPALADGPTWLQQWLVDNADFASRYQGTYNGGAALPPGVTTPDARTIVFRFARPRPDLPFAASLGYTTPVPRARDTKTEYDNRPVASGPYRVETYQRGTQLVLVRNRHWRADTDPVRHAYPDRLVFTFGQDPVTATRRILAGNGPDRTAISWETVPSALQGKVAADAAAARHATAGATAYVGYLAINTQRVKDLAVRRALNCAIDRDGYIKAGGGRATAEPATTLLPRMAAGYRDYNAYDCGPSGDPARARKMLGGKTVTLSYGFRNNARGQKIAGFLRASLARSGIDLRLVPLPSTGYFSTVRAKGNTLDLHMNSWGADWPSGATVLPALLDGRTIAATGNTNTSYLDSDAVDAELDRIGGLTELGAAPAAWGALDEKVMLEHAPVVPVYYDRTYSLNGAGVGGLAMHEVYGGTSLAGAYVK
jgi:peptide/nickel transport system substrate-binding protein